MQPCNEGVAETTCAVDLHACKHCADVSIFCMEVDNPVPYRLRLPSKGLKMVDALKQETGITDPQLNCRIKEDKLFELAGLLGNHELYTGVPGFGLNSSDKDDLKDCVARNGHQHAMAKAFRKWFNITPSVKLTYRSLVMILIELRKKSVAEAVCRTGELNCHALYIMKNLKYSIIIIVFWC